MKKIVVISLLLASTFSEAKSNIGVGLELGGAPTFLFSDMTNQVFGLGFGHQLSLSVNAMQDKPMGAKVRVDRVYLRQEALNRANSDYLAPNTHIKAMSQQWLMIGGGLEWREKGAGHTFIWEALAGYALGVSGIVEVTPKQGIATAERVGVEMENRFFIGGGAGVRRPWKDNLILTASARTFILIGAPYAGKLENRYYLPLPALLSVGLEYMF